MSPDLIVAFAASLANLQSQYPNVSYIPTDAAAKVLSTRCSDEATQPIAIDVRSPEEYAASHIPGAVRIDYNSSSAEVMTFYSALSISNRTDVIVYCLSGKRASEFVTTMMAVADQLMADGDPTGPKPQVIAGSIAKWVNEERPLVTGENWPEYRILVSPSSSSLKLVEPDFVFNPPSGFSGFPPGVGSGSGIPMSVINVIVETSNSDREPNQKEKDIRIKCVKLLLDEGKECPEFTVMRTKISEDCGDKVTEDDIQTLIDEMKKLIKEKKDKLEKEDKQKWNSVAMWKAFQAAYEDLFVTQKTIMDAIEEC